MKQRIDLVAFERVRKQLPSGVLVGNEHERYTLDFHEPQYSILDRIFNRQAEFVGIHSFIFKKSSRIIVEASGEDVKGNVHYAIVAFWEKMAFDYDLGEYELGLKTLPPKSLYINLEDADEMFCGFMVKTYSSFG